MRFMFSILIFFTAVYSWYTQEQIPVLPLSQNVITVNNSDQLLSAVSSAVEGQTVLLNDGHYYLTQSLRLRINGITLRGASNDPTKVIIHGQGFGTGLVDEELIKIENSNITIAYITIKDVRANGIKIQTSNTSNVLIYNVHFIDICERSIKSPELDMPSKNGTVRFCYFEQITPITTSIPNLRASGDYIAGMDMMYLDGWKIQDNYFKNIRGMNGAGRAAIFIWNTVNDCIVERNIIVNCDRGIAFGNPDIMNNNSKNVKNSIIRNNFISSDKYDAAIEISGVEKIKILNNSIYKKDKSSSRGIRFIDNYNDVLCVNNLLYCNVRYESKTNIVSEKSNLIIDSPMLFRDVSEGDLHLNTPDARVTDAGIADSAITDDFDGEPRDAKPDIGADEFKSSKVRKSKRLIKPHVIPSAKYNLQGKSLLTNTMRNSIVLKGSAKSGKKELSLEDHFSFQEK